jgi:hypothetical protein
MNDRFILTAIVDRIIFEEEQTFREADAEELLHILPPPSLWRHIRLPVAMTVKGSITGSQTESYAAGVGNVSVPEQTKIFEFDSRSGRTVRVGQWKIRHVAGFWAALRGLVKIEIEQVATDGGLDGKAATMEYAGGRPVRLLQQVPQSGEFGQYIVTRVMSVPWKTPAVR